MKIVNVNKFYYVRGGAERYFFSLANLLTAHGHEVIPFSMQHPLNLPTPYAHYFPSYVEFGGKGWDGSTAPHRRHAPASGKTAGLGGGGPSENAVPVSTATKLSGSPRLRLSRSFIDASATVGGGGAVDPSPKNVSRSGRATGSLAGVPLERLKGGIQSHPERSEGFTKEWGGLSSVPLLGVERGIPAGDGSTLNTLRVLARMFWSREVAQKFEALLSDTKPDLVHLHNIYHQLSPSLLPVAKRHKLPVVMTVHDYKLIWPDYLLCGFHEGASPWNVVRNRCTHGSYSKSLLTFLEWRLHQLLRVYAKHIDLFLAPSQFVRDMLERGGIPKDKIQVLPHFVNGNSKFEIRNSKFEIRNSKLRAKPSLLYFGRLSKEKGLDILLQMMHTIGSEVMLRIAGEGPELERLKFEVRSSKLRAVVFLGQLDSTALAKEIDRALFTVVPSIVPETFGYTILESFARGKPVVASRIGAFPELVHDRETGLLVPPHDLHALTAAVQFLLTHKKERRAMGKKARATAAHYTSTKHAKALMEFYQRLL